MIKIKSMKLKNYCGYRDFEIDFTDGEDVKMWAILYGPNGSFKSTFLQAVDLLINPTRFTMKKNMLTFRRLKYHEDYAAGSEATFNDVSHLIMEAVFDVNGIEKKVVLEDNVNGVIFAGRQVDESKGEISGVRTNDLTRLEEGVIFIDADSKNMMTYFQIIDELVEPFCDFATAVYGLKCYCPEKTFSYDRGMKFIGDFVIEKPDRVTGAITKVHYKKFSDGEKKLATLISSLFKRAHKDSPDRDNSNIVIIDNVECHIYWKRHMILLRKMEEHFSDMQFIATTHSPVIIKEMDKKHLVDME